MSGIPTAYGFGTTADAGLPPYLHVGMQPRGMFRRVLPALADRARRKPWQLLGANAVVLFIGLALALGAPERLATGSLRLDAEDAGPRAAPDLVVVARGPTAVGTRIYGVALGVIGAQVRADSAVARVRRAPVRSGGGVAVLEVDLRTDSARERQEAIRRIEREIDPGPLRVLTTGETKVLDEARAELGEELWRLELLALPLSLLVLVAGFGLRLAAAPLVCAATALAGTLAALRLIEAVFGGVSLLGIVPAAALAVVLGVELPGLIVARFRAAGVVAGDDALGAAVEQGGRSGARMALAASVAPAGLLITPLDQVPSILLACALAAVFALASALVVTPAMLAATHAARETEPRSRVGQTLQVAPRFLAERRLRAGAVALACAGALLALGIPGLHGESRPFAASDLPASAEAHRGAKLAAVAAPAQRPRARPERALAAAPDSLFPELPAAAGLSLGLLALLFGARARGGGRLGASAARGVIVAIAGLLPAIAACGLAVFVFQDGDLAGTIGQERQGAVETGALAALLAALAAICAARCAAAVAARTGHPASVPPAVARAAARTTLPAAVTSTLVAGWAAAVLAGSDLVPAREFGLAVAAGLVLDLVLVRLPLLSALARWGR